MLSMKMDGAGASGPYPAVAGSRRGARGTGAGARAGGKGRRPAAAGDRSHYCTNKASGGDGIPVELYQILKDDAVKVLHSICQQIWKTQQ